MNNLLLIIAMILLSNGSTSLFDNKNKSNKSIEESMRVETNKSIQNEKNNPKVRKVKKIKKKPRVIDSKNNIKDPIKNIFKFDRLDVNKGINLLDLDEEDLDRGMEIITRTKKYMNKDERNILIKLESVLDLVKGIKKLNDINILSEEDESEFFRSMEEEDKKNMMIKEILEVFPENKKQSVEKALEMKKIIDLFAEILLPDGEDGSGFSLSSLVDINNLGSASNLKLLGSLLRNLDSDDEDDEKEKQYDYMEVEEVENEYIENDEKEEEEDIISYDEYLKQNEVTNKSKKNRSRRKIVKRKRRS